MRITCTFIAFVLLLAAGNAQTTGVSGVNDFVANGNGSGSTSAVPTNVNFVAGTGELTNSVSASPGDVVVPLDGNISPGAADIDGTMTYFIDLFPFNITLDPATPPVGLINFQSLLTVPSSGEWELTLVFSAPIAGLAQQYGVLGGAFPIGIGSTQAHVYSYPVAPMAPPNPICGATPGVNTVGSLGDDSSVLYNFINGPFFFYGVSYNGVFVNMNGNLTFGLGNSDFAAAEATMLSDEPRIAPTWDDFTPNDTAQGDVLVLETATDVAFEWYDVRHFGGACTAANGNPDSNTFCALLDYPTEAITFSYADMGLCSFGLAPSTDQVVGISPGTNLSGFNNVDLATGGVVNMMTAAGANDAVYEDFGQAVFGPFDLGNLASMTFTPTGGGGTGPYMIQ